MSVTIPEKYKLARTELGFDEVGIGFNGITLFTLDELDGAQIGYSKSPNGESLCEGREGQWQPQWLVIGNEPVCGDPIILDTSDSNLPVFYDLHGQGKWEPAIIALTLDTFIESLREIRKLSVGRSDPVSLVQNPVTEGERARVIEKIKSLNSGDDSSTSFWEDMLLDNGEESDR